MFKLCVSTFARNIKDGIQVLLIENCKQRNPGMALLKKQKDIENPRNEISRTKNIQKTSQQNLGTRHNTHLPVMVICEH